MFQRPTSVTVMAVIGLLLGAFGLLCCSFGLLDALVKFPAAPPAVDGPFAQAVEAVHQATSNPLVRALLGLYNLAAVGLSGLLIAASIGSLMMRRWGRSAMIAYSVLWMANALFGNVVQAVFVMPAVSGAMEQIMGPGIPPGAMAVGMVLGAACNVLCLSIYPIAALVIFNNARVKAAFEAGGYVAVPPPQPAYPYGQPLYGFPPPEVAGPQYPGQYPQQPPPPGPPPPPPGSYPPPPSDPSDYHRQ